MISSNQELLGLLVHVSITPVLLTLGHVQAPEGLSLCCILQSSTTTQLQKFAECPANVWFIGGREETQQAALFGCIVGWCESNHLLLNVSKTQEMVLSFRTGTKPTVGSILGKRWKYLKLH